MTADQPSPAPNSRADDAGVAVDRRRKGDGRLACFRDQRVVDRQGVHARDAEGDFDPMLRERALKKKFTTWHKQIAAWKAKAQAEFPHLDAVTPI